MNTTSSKKLLFDDAAREQLLDGVNILANAVRVTMGPRGQNVVIENPGRPPHLTKDGVTVAPGVMQCAKLGIYQAMREQGIRKTELARRLHWHMPQVDRLLDLGHASRFSQVERAISALGRRIELQMF